MELKWYCPLHYKTCVLEQNLDLLPGHSHPLSRFEPASCSFVPGEQHVGDSPRQGAYHGYNQPPILFQHSSYLEQNVQPIGNVIQSCHHRHRAKGMFREGQEGRVSDQDINPWPREDIHPYARTVELAQIVEATTEVK